MMKSPPMPRSDPDSIAPLPGWITSACAESPEDVAFLSGAALAHLHLVATSPDLPHGLWRARLALAAAEACAGFAGRREGAAALRDAVHLTKPGGHPGPAGAILQDWQRAVAGRMPARDPEAAGQATPVARAAAALEAVLADSPRAEAEALMLADAVLSRALGWDHVTPLLAIGLKARDLRLRDDDLRRACHRALLAAAGIAVPLAADLTRRAARLRAVAPKLRAKDAGRAVDLFLARDALAPSALPLPDRAARRLCDRLVELGAVRELTGRDTFRLYGV